MPATAAPAPASPAPPPAQLSAPPAAPAPPAAATPATAAPQAPAGNEPRRNGAWPEICERFALQLLSHAEHIRPALDNLEADEHDEERLKWLYQVDHAVTRMRRVARDLRILAGVEDGEIGGYTSSLVDVIRAAESSIEHYPKVVIGRVVELAVVAYAADDFASLLAALLDNATNYSPSTVTVSAHLLDSGSVMLRIEDNGIGIPLAHLDILNAALAGPVPEVNERTGKHTGFPVVHRLARKHGVGVRLASRREGGSHGGTVAMVTIPPDLLCEVPEEAPEVGGPTEPAGPPEPPPPPPAPSKPYMGGGPSPHLSVARPSQFGQALRPSTRSPESATSGGLPRRTRTSLRGEETGRARGGPAHVDTSASARAFADDLSAFTTGGQAARNGQPLQPGKPGQAPEAGQPGQASDGGQPGQAPEAGQPGRAPESGQPGQAPESGQSGQASEAGQSGRAPEAGQPGRAPESGQPGQAPESGQSGQAPESGQSGQASDGGQSGRAPEAGQSGQERESGQSGQVPQVGQTPQTPQAGQSGQTPKAGQSGQTSESDQAGRTGQDGPRAGRPTAGLAPERPEGEDT